MHTYIQDHTERCDVVNGAASFVSSRSFKETSRGMKDISDYLYKESKLIFINY